MKPLIVNLFDSSFAHSRAEDGFDTCTKGKKPTKIKWTRNLMKFEGITVFTDNYLNNSIIDKVKSTTKVAWLLEPRAINPNIYKIIKKTEEKFNYIFTHDKRLLKRSKKYIMSLVGGSWVDKEDWGITKKEKLISLICSKRNFTSGHKMRHNVKPNLGEKYIIDFWGREYREFENQSTPLKPYYFSIAISNSRAKNYFTEKLVDCFLVGTFPIYWGAPNIGEYFNKEGIITFNTIKELDKVLSKIISPSYYNSHIAAISDNFERAKKMSSTDDMLATLLMEL